MLHEFLSSNRTELVERCRDKVTERSPGLEQRQLHHGIGPLLEQVIETLRLEESGNPAQGQDVSGPPGGQTAGSEIGDTANAHGRELLARGYTIEEVVHDYGDLCQSVTSLAFEREVAIDADEFRTFNLCLDTAIASAVAEFAAGKEPRLAAQRSEDSKHRLGAYANDVRNLVNTATLAVKVIKSGRVGMIGATGVMLERSLAELDHLTNKALVELRQSAPA
jgi:hypothetical protein